MRKTTQKSQKNEAAHIGAWLCTQRKSAGISRAVVAHRVGVDAATVWRWERVGVNITVADAIAYAAAIGRSPRVMLGKLAAAMTTQPAEQGGDTKHAR